MATQIRSSIAVLLAARRERQVHLYGKRQFLGTLMRHFRAVALLASRVRESTVAACLVCATGPPHAFGARRPSAPA